MLRATNRPAVAFFDAIKNLRLRQVALILKAGYDPNLLLNGRSQNGLQFMIQYFGATDAHFRLQAPINKAAYLGIAKLLLDSGLDPNTVDLLSGETVIFDAIRLNDRDMVSLLLNYSDFSIRNKDGETALMCAARFGGKQVMRIILEHLRQLDLDAYFLRQRNRYGLSALELARAENLECAKILAKHLINYGIQQGPTPVHHLQQRALLAQRSSSHHQLAGPSASLPVPMALQTSASILVDDSASDYESDFLAPPTPAAFRFGRATGSQRQRAARAAAVAAAAAAYDPRAAEFNQYLIEQHQMGGQQQQHPESSSMGQKQQQQRRPSVGQMNVTDDDEDDEAGPMYTGSGQGGLTRSRSCILGPSTSGGSRGKQQQQQQLGGCYGGASGSRKVAANEAKGAVSSSWDSQRS